MRLYLIRLKVLLRDRANLFWAFLFPLILGVFFQLGFGNLNPRGSIDSINAYMARDKIDANLSQIMQAIEYDDGKPLFILDDKMTAEELEGLLVDEKIRSYIYFDDELYYRVRANGLEETITKSFLDEYLQTQEFYLDINNLDPAKQAEILADLGNSIDYFEELDSSTKTNTNAFVIYFYALIAMACMFGSYWGVVLINDLQADNSVLAARISISPVPKMKMIILSFLAALTIQFLGNLLLIVFLKYILGVEFASNIFLIILASFVGTISGISLGVLLSAVIPGTYNMKQGLLTIISLLLSTLAGLMSVDIKYLVDKYLPVLPYINPANLVTESFYSLYYYSSLDRYFLNLSILLLLSIIMILISFLKIRRLRYDSI